jgi:hypothetical protein
MIKDEILDRLADFGTWAGGVLISSFKLGGLLFWLVSVSLLAVSCCRCVIGAPLPPPRPVVVKPGEYELTWHGSIYNVRLAADGSYEAWNGASGWTGTYRVEGGMVHVREWLLSSDGGSPLEWTTKPPGAHAAPAAVTLRKKEAK